jgi:CubicO group peptidase (beta-lactamase class C family)
MPLSTSHRLIALGLALAGLPGAVRVARAQVTESRSARPPESRYASLERVIDEEMRTRGSPGVAIVVVEDGRPTYRRAFGIADIESGTAMSTQQLVQIGSATKVFTALTAVLMAQEGEVALDTPIKRYVSELAPRIGALTLRQLLAQTSGLRDEPADSGRQDEHALLEYARSLPDSAIRLPPGEAFSYSNVGFALAGLVLQEAARTPYAELVRARLLRPMLLVNTAFRPTDAMTYARAEGHAAGKDGTLRVVRPVANDTRYWPAGYLYASADDLGRLVTALLEHGALDGGPVLPAAAIDSLLAPQVPVPGLANEDLHYGLGIFLDRWRGARRAWHPGSMPGHSTLLELVPEKRLGVAVTANRDGIRLDRIAETALESLTQLPGGDEKPVGGGVAPSIAELRLLEGTYEGRFPLELRMRGDSLVLKRFGAELTVRPLGGDRYAVQNPGAPRPDVFRIAPPASGRPPYIQMFLWSFPRTRAARPAD